MTEPDVVITDYLLAAECFVFAWMLWHQDGPSAWSFRGPFVAFFVATSVGSIAGGTVHGFFLSNTSSAGVVLWRGALLSIGVAAFCAWVIGARLLAGPGAARVIQIAASLVFVAYAVVILWVADNFRIAVVNYLPPTIFLIVGLVAAYKVHSDRALAIGAAGLVLTVVAAAIQQFRIAVHPQYFNHNALYHAIQAVGLFMIFVAARMLVAARAGGFV